MAALDMFGAWPWGGSVRSINPRIYAEDKRACISPSGGPVEVLKVMDSRQRQTHVERDEMKGAREDATSVVGNKLESKLELTKPS